MNQQGFLGALKEMFGPDPAFSQDDLLEIFLTLYNTTTQLKRDVKNDNTELGQAIKRCLFVEQPYNLQVSKKSQLNNWNKQSGLETSEIHAFFAPYLQKFSQTLFGQPLDKIFIDIYGEVNSSLILPALDPTWRPALDTLEELTSMITLQGQVSAVFLVLKSGTIEAHQEDVKALNKLLEDANNVGKVNACNSFDDPLFQ